MQKKSSQIILELWRDDELDIWVHLVLCGRQSDFAMLWETIERTCGPAALADLADRLLLAVNGMNIYFTNPDISSKYSGPETAKREGDHFATTLEDNILQKMSPRGRVRPARICFLDAKPFVETAVASYASVYASYLPIMEKWTERDGIGYETLSRLGLLESFKQNMAALIDPVDRGQIFLIRQICDRVKEKGPRLLIRKHLLRSGLLKALGDFLELLEQYYDDDGRTNREAINEALRSCLSFLDANDSQSIESFAADKLDGPLEDVALLSSREAGGDWVTVSYHRACEKIKQTITEQIHHHVPPDVQAQFERYFAAQQPLWAKHLGYNAARMVVPRGGTNAVTLLS